MTPASRIRRGPHGRHGHAVSSLTRIWDWRLVRETVISGLTRTRSGPARSERCVAAAGIRVQAEIIFLGMKLFFSFLAEWFWRFLVWIGMVSKRARILVLGLDNAGKSTLIYMLKMNKIPGCLDKTQIVWEDEMYLNKMYCR